MVARSPNYVLILILIVVTTGIAVWARETPSRVLCLPDLATVPQQFGRWEGKDVPLSKEEIDKLDVDALLNRAYTDSLYGTHMGLLVEYRKYGRRGFIHRPEECFPGAGLEIVDTRTITVPYAGKSIEATMLIAQRKDDGSGREIVVYWYACGTETQHDYLKQQWSMALDRFRNRKYGWTFIRLICPVTSSDDETIDSIRTFAGLTSAPLYKCLTAGNAKK